MKYEQRCGEVAKNLEMGRKTRRELVWYTRDKTFDAIRPHSKYRNVVCMLSPTAANYGRSNFYSLRSHVAYRQNKR